jgi:ABC-type lipoprotein export system ATPase subunit
MLELRQLTKEFAGPAAPVRALDGCTLSVAAGEFVALRGPSGCGTTTLLLAAGGLLRPSSGSVRVGGEAPWEMSPRARAEFRARRIGFVFQQYHLVPYLSVLENVLAPLVAGPAPGAEARAEQLICRLRLEHRTGHLPAHLSTGERQRVALARALLRQPPLVLADEPTGNLDEASAAIVTECLAEYARTGASVLMVTHDPLAVAHANRRLRMEKGRVSGEDALGIEH